MSFVADDIPLHKRFLGVIASAVFCCVAAGPSAFMAISFLETRHLDMILVGVGAFAALTGAIVWSDWFWRHWRESPFRKAILTVVGLRIALLIGFPVGIFVDALCAFPSAILVALLFGSDVPSRVGVLLWTLLHGLVLSSLMLALGRLAFIDAQRHAPGYVHPICSGCDYDLRASTGACPECGRAIPETIAHLCGQTPRA